MPATKLLLVVPANNTSMAPAMRALCPTVARIDVARVARPARMLTVEDLPAYGETTLEAIEPYLHAGRPCRLESYCTLRPLPAHCAAVSRPAKGLLRCRHRTNRRPRPRPRR